MASILSIIKIVIDVKFIYDNYPHPYQVAKSLH